MIKVAHHIVDCVSVAFMATMKLNQFLLQKQLRRNMGGEKNRENKFKK